VVFVAVRKHDGLQVSALLFCEGDVGHDEIDTGRFAIPERNSHIDAKPLTTVARGDPIKREIHPDLADAAERREQKFLLILCQINLPADRRKYVPGSNNFTMAARQRKHKGALVVDRLETSA
jgi:hypothetical protein